MQNQGGISRAMQKTVNLFNLKVHFGEANPASKLVKHEQWTCEEGSSPTLGPFPTWSPVFGTGTLRLWNWLPQFARLVPFVAKMRW